LLTALPIGFVMLLVSALPAEAVPGDLDPSFGAGGQVVTQIGGSDDHASSVAVQPDGKIIVGGYSWNGGEYDFALARYTTTGALDTTFDGDGKVVTPVSASRDGISAVAIQPDGKIVVAGTSNGDFAVARYTGAGSLDQSFGVGGLVVTSFSPSPRADVAYAMTIQPDGRIVAAGSAGSSAAFALARYTTTGSLDSTFGTQGKVVTFVSSNQSEIMGVALQGDGRIIAGGYAYNSPGFDFAIARYSYVGTLDPSFGNGGVVTTAMGSYESFGRAVAIQADGKIVLAGSSSDTYFTESDFALARYTPEGALDTGFGIGGKVTTFMGRPLSSVRGVAVQSNGQIVAGGSAGYYGAESGEVFALARYTSAGALDTTFGGDGKVATSFSAHSDGADDIALQPDGKIVAAGVSSRISPNPAFALARYLSDGIALPSLSIGDARVREGRGTQNRTMSFTVTLSQAGSETVTVHYATVDGTATAPSDYAAKAGTLNFSPGQTTKTLNVTVKGDLRREPTEVFYVNLTNPVGATVADGRGVGSIIDND
jgi:uncharacterized delta-60 repeat protein